MDLTHRNFVAEVSASVLFRATGDGALLVASAQNPRMHDRWSGDVRKAGRRRTSASWRVLEGKTVSFWSLYLKWGMTSVGREAGMKVGGSSTCGSASSDRTWCSQRKHTRP